MHLRLEPTAHAPTGPNPFVVVVEGIDCSGKTTLSQALQAELARSGYRVKGLHDPKGTANSRRIWETILQLKRAGGHATTEFFLFLAARNELIHREAFGGEAEVLLLDRFVFSTLAYQLTDQPDAWGPFLTIHRFFTKLMPDLCVYCDLDFDTFRQRSAQRGHQDALDQLPQARFEAIRAAYARAFQLGLCPTLQLAATPCDLAAVAAAVRSYLPPPTTPPDPAEAGTWPTDGAKASHTGPFLKGG